MKETKYIIVTENNTVVCENLHYLGYYYYHTSLLSNILSDGLHDSLVEALSELEFIKSEFYDVSLLKELDYDKFKIKECEVTMELNIKGDVEK